MSLFGKIENDDEAIRALQHIKYLIMKLDAGSIAHERPVILNDVNRIGIWLKGKD